MMYTRRLACLLLIGILSMVAFSSLASAQIEHIGIVVTDYDPSKIMPGGTLDVSFILYKPAGIEIEGTLGTWVGFDVGDVRKWYWCYRYEVLGSLENISWGTEEKQEEFTLSLKILDNIPVQTGEMVRLGAGLKVGCSYVLLDVDNNSSIEQNKDNILFTVENRDFNKLITYIRDNSALNTSYYISNSSFVSTYDSAFYVLGYDTAQMLEPPSNIWPTIAIVAAGVGAAIAICIVLILRRR